ncbi:MAG: L,D-transpeptidase, partial [Verrucomicrobiota bacterium]
KGKRVEIDLTKQQLKAYEGSRVVLKTNISSGRTNNTPTGNFRAGPYKSAEHYSSLYHNAPMPWSVQITGHIFIHGYTEVPPYPASKGCVRVPLTGRNPAKRLFKWIDIGTPIRIYRS